MMKYDSIVVGLGPAGATAVYEMSKRGYNILAFDKQKHPRYKPCGGGLSARIEKIIDSDFKNIVEREINKVNFVVRGAGEIHAVSKNTIVFMVMRNMFDNFLIEKARNLGAEIHETEKVVRLEERENYVVVVTEKNKYFSDFVIGADGISNTVANSIGLKPNKRNAVVIEAEIKVKEKLFKKLNREMFFDFGYIPYGYAWIFPKAHHLSIGAGGIKKIIKNPKPYYLDFLSKYEIIDEIETKQEYIYTIPVFNGKSKLTTSRTILIGDSAALVNPFLGEGIYYAIRSGQIAAEVIDGVFNHRNKITAYQEYIEKEIYRDFEYSQKIGDFFYRFPKIGYKILKSYPEYYEVIFEVLRGDLEYEYLWNLMKNKIKFILRF